MNSYYTICIKIVWFYRNSYKNHKQLYEFVSMNSNKNYTICTVRIVLYELCCTHSYNKKNGIKTFEYSNPCTNTDLTQKPPSSSTAHRMIGVFYKIYPHTEIFLKKTIQNMRLYKFIRVAYSHPFSGKTKSKYTMWGHENWKKDAFLEISIRVSPRNFCWDTFFGFHKKTRKVKKKYQTKTKLGTLKIMR